MPIFKMADNLSAFKKLQKIRLSFEWKKNFAKVHFFKYGLSNGKRKIFMLWAFERRRLKFYPLADVTIMAALSYQCWSDRASSQGVA